MRNKFLHIYSTRPVLFDYLIGYAYYLRDERGGYVKNINTDQAWPGSAELGLQAPTTVLMKPRETLPFVWF